MPVPTHQAQPAWSLNTSQNPNVAADVDLKFYADADITTGDELNGGLLFT